MRRRFLLVHALSAALLASVVLAAGCKASPPREGQKCREEGIGSCLDPTHMAKCVGGVWDIETCLGPAGCKEQTGSYRCDQSVATVGTRCTQGHGACTPDGKQLLDCKNGAMAVEAACGGPAGCAYDTGSTMARCDESLAEPGDPCSDEGKSACSHDKKQMLSCKGGQIVTAYACKGAKACAVEAGNVTCDLSVGDLGDACPSDGGYACSPDHSRALLCKAGKLGAGRACKKGCTIKGDDVMCP